MAEDDELEKRAVEELLKETDRARLRAETMGPAGWLKCPLRSTNKRFLLNTLRSTGLQRHSSEPRDGHPTSRGRHQSRSPDRGRDRSRTPPRVQSDHKDNHRDKPREKHLDKDRRHSHRHTEDRHRRHTDGKKKDKDRNR
ncbi:protein POLR1D [Gouania willdenowi]|uniref:Uncharacterized protein n=1 Tax=Gouania willdenowi TaxID=441366 RepID=A0A8C5GMY1_GOUWI|nr:protein POLR1D [Gouania willdenowi]